jgi:hypothetical protein
MIYNKDTNYLELIQEFLSSMQYADNIKNIDNKLTFSKTRYDITMTYEIWVGCVENCVEAPTKLKFELFYKNQIKDSIRLKKSVLYDPNEETFELLLNRILEKIIRDFERVFNDFN